MTTDDRVSVDSRWNAEAHCHEWVIYYQPLRGKQREVKVVPSEPGGPAIQAAAAYAWMEGFAEGLKEQA